VLVGAFDDRDTMARVLLCELEQCRRQQIAARQWHRADHGTAGFPATQRMHFGARLLDLREGEPNPTSQLVRVASRRDAETRLLEQCHAEQPLELARRAMDAGLGNLPCACGDAEIAVLDHDGEGVELTRTHQAREGGALGPRAAPHFAECVAKLIHSPADSRRGDLAGRGQRHPCAPPQQQRRSEVAFEARDRLRHRGL
jgi:hypothetical protein